MSETVVPVDDVKKDGETAPPEGTPEVDETFDYPADTPLAEMSPKQQVEYWREKAQKHEKRAKQAVPPDYAELRRYREEAERAKLSDTDKAIQKARDEGYAEATTKTLTAAAVAIYRAGLSARGVPAEELNDLVDAFNAGKFIKDGDIDTDKISTIAARVAGTAKGTGKEWPDMGQGHRPPTALSPGVAGKAEADRRFGQKSA